MNRKEQARFDALYQQHLTELKLQGLAPATVDAYSRAVRRISGFFDCCPDGLTRGTDTPHISWKWGLICGKSSASWGMPMRKPPPDTPI